MRSKKLKTLVEEIVHDVLNEDRQDIADDYVASMKKRHPELHDELVKQAEFAIQSVRNGYLPSDKIISINNMLNLEDDLDPRDSGDTHGVRLYIDHMVNQEDPEDGGEFSGKVKRWYQQTLDALLKKVYSESTIKEYNDATKSAVVELVQKTLMGTISENPFTLKEEVRQPFVMKLPSDLMRLADIFTLNNFELYVVGGAVRDALLGKDPKDYDVATNAKPDQVLAMLARHPQYKTLEVGKSFGVINVITPDGEEYEVATFRSDIGKGRRPDAVEFTTIEQDVKRRDLTINALFYDIAKQEVVDYVGGIEDLRRGLVRAVGSASERFDEDRLRILRAIRFAARMGAGLDNETEEAILKDNSLQGVSPERIRDEFLKSVKSAKSVQALMRLYDGFNLWKQVLPGLRINNWYQETKNVPVLLALLLRDNNPKSLGKKLNQLKYNVIETRQIVFLVMLQNLNPENAYQLKKLWKATRLPDEALEEFARLGNQPKMQLVKAFNKYQPSVSGKDLLAQGLKGRELGQELERLETEEFKKLM